MSQIFKPTEQKEEENSFDAGFKLPDTKSMQQKLAASTHQLQMEEEEKAEKAGKPRKQRPKPKRGTICFCMNEACNIGGFIERQG